MLSWHLDHTLPVKQIGWSQNWIDGCFYLGLPSLISSRFEQKLLHRLRPYNWSKQEKIHSHSVSKCMTQISTKLTTYWQVSHNYGLTKYPRFCWSLFTSAFSKLQADTVKKKQFINQHKVNKVLNSCILLSISNLTAFVTKWNEAWAWWASHSV
jgi:hypothetical protein